MQTNNQDIQEKISQMILDNGLVSLEQIKTLSVQKFDTLLVDAEESLSLSIPDSYLWFLSKYTNVNILGIDLGQEVISNRWFFVSETLDYRNGGLETNLIYLNGDGELMHCLNVDNGTIYNWALDGDDPVKIYDSFYDYLYDLVVDVLEEKEDM